MIIINKLMMQVKYNQRDIFHQENFHKIDTNNNKIFILNLFILDKEQKVNYIMNESNKI